MADYLFRAPDTDMARWKADAEKRGRSFAEHMRASLDLVHRCPTSLLDQLLGPVNRLVEAASVPAGTVKAEAASTGRQVEPDPK